MYKLALSFVLSSSLFLSGCIPLVVGGVAAASYMSSQERGMKSALSDINIKTYIKDKLTGQYYKYLTQVEVSVLKGNVLLTGVVKSPKAAAEVESIVRGVENVGDVYNELFTDGIYSTVQYSKDTWMATQLKSRLLTADRITSPNYQILVVNDNAYIFGLAEDMAEMEAVRHVVRTTGGVARVHSYVSLYKPEALISKDTFTMPSIDSEDYITD